MQRITNKFMSLTLVLIMVLFLGACGTGSDESSGGGTITNPPDPGNLDTAFGTVGKVTTNILAYEDQAYAVAIQTDGKIVVAGFANNGAYSDFAVLRYTAAGVLDATFGSGGKVVTPIGSYDDYARAMAIQTDGKIVVAGYYFNGFYNKIALVRYNSNGSLDTGFGTGGLVLTDVGSYNDEAYAVAIQSTGEIVVAGSTQNATRNEFALVRYTVNGFLDNSFNTTGKVITGIGSGGSAAYSVAIQADKRIVAAGYSNNGSGDDFAIVRYYENGSLDTTFNFSGIITTAVSSEADVVSAVVIQPTDQKIVVAGSAVVGGKNNMALVRYNPAGTLDTGFGSTGRVTTAFGSGNAIAYGIRLQSDGKIVVAGCSDVNGNNDFALARYSAAGALDTTFKNTGKVTTAIGSADDCACGVALQSDGKIVVAGYSFNGTDNDFALARYWP